MRHSIVLVTLAFFSLCYIGSTYSSERPRPPRITSQSGPNAKNVTRRVLDAGRLAMNITDRGYIAEYPEFANDTLGWFSQGSYWVFHLLGDPLWPVGARMVYDQGPEVYGKVNGTPGAALVMWAGTFMPGPMINGLPAMDVNPGDSSRYHPYRISRSNKPEDQEDYQSWPGDLGAPLDSGGGPRVKGDQLVWCLYNGADSTVWPYSWRPRIPNDTGRPQFPRLPVEVHQEIYTHRANSGTDTSLLANVVFTEWTFINKGSSTIDSCYLALWNDMDIDPDYGRPSVDTSLALGYCWTSRTPGPDEFLARAAGYVLLYGPTVPDPDGVATMRGKRRAGYRNLGPSSFLGFSKDTGPDSALWAAPTNIKLAWNAARGYDKLGRPIVDPTTGQVTPFPYSGDPVTGTGWLWDTYFGNGEGFALFSGPFTFAAGDTQWMMTALVPADSGDYKQSVTTLREYARRLHNMSYEDLIAPTVPLTVGQDKNGSGLPVRPTLDQNYPNPFNPSTTIRYSLSARSRVTLTVFNTLGQQIATLVNGEVEAGYHEVQFDALMLASGIYFYRLSASPLTRRDLFPTDGRDGQAANFTQTRKLCLIR